MIEKFLCFFGWHKQERIKKNIGVAGGSRCARKGCNWKIDPIQWPAPRPPIKNN